MKKRHVSRRSFLGGIGAAAAYPIAKSVQNTSLRQVATVPAAPKPGARGFPRQMSWHPANVRSGKSLAAFKRKNPEANAHLVAAARSLKEEWKSLRFS